MRLVDDGGGSQHPSGDPSGSETGTPDPSRSPSGDPSKSGDDEEEDGQTPGDNSSEDDSALISMPVAAQAGLSLGVIMLAAVALIPGRKPPARLRS